MAVHCPVCGWRFGSENALRDHVAAHHGQVDQASTAPAEGAPEAATEPSPQRGVGTVRLLLSYAAAVLFPLVGLFVGLFLLTRSRRHGIAVIAVSIAVGAIGLALVGDY